MVSTAHVLEASALSLDRASSEALARARTEGMEQSAAGVGTLDVASTVPAAYTV